MAWRPALRALAVMVAKAHTKVQAASIGHHSYGSLADLKMNNQVFRPLHLVQDAVRFIPQRPDCLLHHLL